MKDYPPLPDGLPRVLSASSALTACPDSVCPVLDAPELEELSGSPDRWIAGRLRRLPLRNEDNEPRRIRDLSAGYAEQGFELRRLGARLLLADGVTSVAEARAAVLGGRQTGLPVMICVELDDEGETPEGIPFASILASVQHLGVAAVGFRCSGDRIDTLSILGQHAAFAAVPLMPVLRSRGRSPEEIQVHAMQALRAGGDLFLLGNSIDDAQLAAAEEALADFRPTDRVIEQDRETLFMACEAEAFYLQPDGLSFCEPIPCQYDMGADILEAEAQGCDVLKVYVDSPEDAENFAENSHMIRLPVCISSHHEVALEMALMEYNGRAFVDLQSELTDSELYTLAKGYGAVVV